MSDEFSVDDLFNNIGFAYELVAADLDNSDRLRKDEVAEKYQLYERLYKPSPELSNAINRYNQSFKKPTLRKQRGDLLEEVAFLAFSSLVGYENISSFTSFDSQLDLIVSGYEVGRWDLLCRVLGLPRYSSLKIILEAKNLNKQIDSNIFSRLCFLLENRHSNQCSLGVFFTRNGASGFPKRGEQQVSLRAARATQVLFHAATKKYIVVFDHSDIQKLTTTGSLVRMLQLKIRDVEDAVGQSTFIHNDKILEEMALPPHLAKHLKSSKK